MNLNFDYGADMQTEGDLIVWPKVGENTCLLDGDLLPYRIGFIVKEMDKLAAEARVMQGEYQTISETPEFLYYANIMCQNLNRIVSSAKCDSLEVFMTDSAKNFRLDLAFSDPYKGTRNPEKPPFFYELRKYLLDKQSANLSDGNEADDQLSIEAWRRAREFCEENDIECGSDAHKAFAKYVVASSDKDLMQVVGWHIVMGADEQWHLVWVDKVGWLEPRYKQDGSMKDLKGAGLLFFYAQIIMGDTTDNYKGLPLKGCKAAYEALNGLTEEKDMYMTVLAMFKKKFGEAYPCQNYRGKEAYRQKYMDVHGVNPPDHAEFIGAARVMTAYEMMLEQGRLAYMQTRPDEIWRADKSPIIWGGKRELWEKSGS